MWAGSSYGRMQRVKTANCVKGILPSSARSDTKAILLPSGDHTGLKVPAAPPAQAEKLVSLVSGVGLEPSLFITQMLDGKFGELLIHPKITRIQSQESGNCKPFRHLATCLGSRALPRKSF